MLQLWSITKESSVLVPVEDSYFELNFYQASIAKDSGERLTGRQNIGLHKCNKDDRSHFYDQTD